MDLQKLNGPFHIQLVWLTFDDIMNKNHLKEDEGIEKIVKFLDENLEYIKHEVSGDRITIWVKSAKKEAICRYWGKSTTKAY